MTAVLLAGCFTHSHNRREVAEQEYEAAKLYFREVSQHRIAGNVDHDRRFRDAVDRQSKARERLMAISAYGTGGS